MDDLSESAPATLAAYLKQWKIGAGQTGPVLSKRRFTDAPERSYSLKGKVPRKYLQSEKQTFGINLGWTDDAEPETAARVSRWFLATRSGDDRVSYGEPVALGVGKPPSFLRYATRDYGINLEWSTEPVYEWKLLGGAPGDPVQKGEWLAVFNTRAAGGDGPGEPLIYFDRTVGGDIGWPSSKTWGDQAIDKVVAALKGKAKDLAYDYLLLGGR